MAKLREYLQGTSDSAIITAFIRRVRAWRQTIAQTKEPARRERVEAALIAMIASDPPQRIPLALQADIEEPGPIPRLISDHAEDWLNPTLAMQLLADSSGRDQRYQPLFFQCTQVALAHGVEDTQTVLIHIRGLLDAGEVDEAKRLALKALKVAEADDTQTDTVETLLHLLGEMAFDEGEFEVALSYWQRILAAEPESPATLNNCGAALQHLVRKVEGARAFRDAARIARRNVPDLEAMKVLAESMINMSTLMLEHGRQVAALRFARYANEHYLDLLARYPREFDLDIEEQYAPLISALHEAGETEKADALSEELLLMARTRYAEAPTIAVKALSEVLKLHHQDALDRRQYQRASAISAELRELAERHQDQPFGISKSVAALAMAAEADTLYLYDEAEAALAIYDSIEDMLPTPTPIHLFTEVFASRLHHAMILGEIGQRAEAVARIHEILPEAEDVARHNNWMWVKIARAYGDLAIIEGTRGRREEAELAIAKADAAFAHVRKGSRAQRIDAIEQAIAIANALAQLRKYEKSTSMLTEAADQARHMSEVDNDPVASGLLYSALNDLGHTEYAAGNCDEAERAFDRASQLCVGAPTDSILAETAVEALLNRAGALAEAQQFEQATTILSEAEPLTAPDSPPRLDYLNHLAVVRSGQQKYIEALELFQQARTIAMDSEDAHRAALNVAATLVDLERWSEARKTACAILQELDGDVHDPDGADGVTIYYWLSAKIVAAQCAVWIEPPERALEEACGALASLRTRLPEDDSERHQLYAHAYQAYGDALAASEEREQARSAWRKARSFFEGDKSMNWHREIERLTKKEMELGYGDNR